MLIHSLGLCFSHVVSCAHWLHFGVVDFPHLLAPSSVLGLCIAAIVLIVCYAIDAPWVGLLLSCFGHDRAKNNFVWALWAGAVSIFCLGLSLVFFASSQDCEGLFCCWYAVVVPWTVLAWPICWWTDKPSSVGLVVLCPLGHVQACNWPLSWRNHAQLGGGSVAERLISTLAYGWVECCNDVASCGTTQLQDKYLLLFVCLISANYLFYELKWACWMFEWLKGCYYFRCILHVLYSCMCF